MMKKKILSLFTAILLIFSFGLVAASATSSIGQQYLNTISMYERGGNLYFARLVDFDQDGIPELLIATDEKYYVYSSDGKTTKPIASGPLSIDADPFRVLSLTSWNGRPCIVIYEKGGDGCSDHIVRYYAEKNGKFEVVHSIAYLVNDQEGFDENGWPLQTEYQIDGKKCSKEQWEAAFDAFYNFPEENGVENFSIYEYEGSLTKEIQSAKNQCKNL